MREGHRAIVADLGAAADQWIHPDYVHHDPLLPEKTLHGRDAYVTAFAGFRDPMPDFTSSPDVVFADGDHSAARWRFKGTHTGEFRGIPPTNKIVEFWGMSIYRWEGGRVVEGWTLFDVLGFNAQLGISAG